MSDITDKYDDLFGKLSLNEQVKLMEHIRMKLKLQKFNEGVNTGPSFEKNFSKGLNAGPYNNQSNSTKKCPTCGKSF
ncbi:hypothetical protein [Leptospira noguchii]|uniref:Uncharacterized protein n=1 Tax=Leptospira noguchii TaxID=28182 RepID=M6VBD5_9LEPT|nr:hypothetical protein [Leptospira noguchii]EMO54757.1 hypothetical protein LEP1GSC172_4299 [Leptospira noguchii]